MAWYSPSPSVPPGLDPSGWRSMIEAVEVEARTLLARPPGVGARSSLLSLEANLRAAGLAADQAAAGSIILGDYYAPALRKSRTMLLAAQQAHGDAAVNELAGFLNANGFPTVANPGALAATVARTEQAITADWERLAAFTRADVVDTLRVGMVAGMNPTVVARRIAQSGEMTYSRALNIGRTEMRDLYTASRLDYMQGSETIKGWWWRARPDGCGICQALHGETFESNEEQLAHHQCFPAGTMVQAPDADSGFTRMYDGTLVRVRTASGRVLAATPNHPVLTYGQGWVPIGSLHRSDDLALYVGDGDDRAAHVQEAEVRIEDRVVALAERGVSVRPGGAGDFHGDGLANQKVHVVGADSGLTPVRVAQAVEDAAHRFLVHGDVREGTLAVLRGSHLRRLVARLPGTRVRRGEHRGPLAWGGVRPPDTHRRRPVPPRNASQRQPSGYDVPADLVAEGNRLLGLPGLVRADRIIEVVRDREWRGHVFNLSTGRGWYLANGYPTANCRCVMVPLVPGITDPDDPRPASAIESQLPGNWPKGQSRDYWRQQVRALPNDGWRPSYRMVKPSGVARPVAPSLIADDGLLQEAGEFLNTGRKVSKEARSLADYMGGEFGPVNEALRGDRWFVGPQQSDIRNLTRGIEDAPRTKTDATVFRGIDADLGNLEPGVLLTDNGFMSTSTSEKYATEFVGGQGTVMRLRLPAGSKAIVGYDAEWEVILQRGSSVRVTGVTGSDGLRVIDGIVEQGTAG